MNSFEMTRRFHEAFGMPSYVKPREPTEAERILRAKLLLEETFETIRKGLGVDIMFETPGGAEYYLDEDVVNVCITPFQDRGYDPVETLDGIADVKVIANGTGVQFGLPVDVADRLVFESNMSKLDENGRPIVNRLVCASCGGLNTSCPDGCGRDPDTGELDGSRYEGNANVLLDPSQPEGKILKSSRYKKVDLESVLRAMWPEREWG